jgi:hypothetical protein
VAAAVQQRVDGRLKTYNALAAVRRFEIVRGRLAGTGGGVRRRSKSVGDGNGDGDGDREWTTQGVGRQGSRRRCRRRHLCVAVTVGSGVLDCASNCARGGTGCVDGGRHLLANGTLDVELDVEAGANDVFEDGNLFAQGADGGLERRCVGMRGMGGGHEAGGAGGGHVVAVHNGNLPCKFVAVCRLWLVEVAEMGAVVETGNDGLLVVEAERCTGVTAGDNCLELVAEGGVEGVGDGALVIEALEDHVVIATPGKAVTVWSMALEKGAEVWGKVLGGTCRRG